MLEATKNSSKQSSASLENSQISTGLNIKASQAVSTLKITKSSSKKAKEIIESIALSSSTVTIPKSQPTSSETGLRIRASSRLKQTIGLSPNSSNLAARKQKVTSEDDENISPRKRSKFNCSR